MGNGTHGNPNKIINMTEEFKLFLKEFAELLERHGVDIEATESGWYEPHCDGITFGQCSQWNKDGETTRERCDYHFRSKQIDHDDITRALEQDDR